MTFLHSAFAICILLQIVAGCTSHTASEPKAMPAAARETNMNNVRVRYMVNNISDAVSFYTQKLDFKVEQGPTPNFVILSRGNLQLVLSTNFGPGGAAKPMLDGRKAEPGGWNRIILNVDDLSAEVSKLKKANVHFRNDIATGPGGSEILLDDPSGNPIELFQPSR